MYTDLERRRLYWIHHELKRRCSPRAKDGDRERYFERGIVVCDRWLGEGGFQNFLDDMGDPPTPEHQINRIDNNAGYYPENCNWVTREEQHANKRARADSVPASICTIIVSAVLSGSSFASIARQYDIQPATASRIFRRWLLERAG